MRMNILLLDHHKTTRSTLEKLFSEHKIMAASDADGALQIADSYGIDIALIELSLAGHSGLEFLYEFRTYQDWLHIPVIIYSSVWIDAAHRSTRAWQQLNVYKYIYKPESTLAQLKDAVEKAVSDMEIVSES